MGIITKKELKKLKEVNASMGLMLETTNKKLLKTITHKNSPGKRPSKRIRLIKQAGKLKIPFTTGLLIGIGESTDDHIDSLYKIREIQDKYHHIQEIIIQNFKPKKGTPMENYPEPKQETMIRLVHLAKILFPDISIQIPPNLNSNQTNKFIQAGADDLGGISPITKDYVNPNEEWPNIINIKNELGSIGYELKERLPVYKKFRKSEYLSGTVYDKCIKLNKKKEYL